jgi:hypothetical protein
VSLLHIEKISSDVKVDTQVQLMHLFQANDARLHSAWVSSLSSLFMQSCFTNVISDIKEALAHLRLTLHYCRIGATEVLAQEKVGEHINLIVFRI